MKNSRYFFLFFALSLIPPIILAEPLICPTLPKFEPATCENQYFFEKQGVPYIEKLNEVFDEKIDMIYRDNIANPTYAVQEAVQYFRTYNSCFKDICQQVIIDCSAHNQNGIPYQEFKWCTQKQRQFFELQQTKVDYVLTLNTGRKYRSLFEEKVGAIGYRFHTYIHNKHMSNTLTYLQKATTMSKWLTPNPIQ